MTPELETIAKQLAAHPKWRWMPGMLAVHTGKGPDDNHPKIRCIAAANPALKEGRFNHYEFESWSGNNITDPAHEYVKKWFIPDLDDPATQGCVVAMARPLMAASDGWANSLYWLGNGNPAPFVRRLMAEWGEP